MPVALPCPWCGEGPVAWTYGGVTKLQCATTDCPVKASVTADDLAEALKLWNARKGPTGDAASAELERLRGIERRIREVVDLPEGEQGRRLAAAFDLLTVLRGAGKEAR